MITIKEFANLCHCNARTLRYYDSIDLLKPIYVNEDTGYRYYKKEQALDYLKIKNLQQAGFLIEEIKSLLNEDDQKCMEEIAKKINLQKNKLKKLMQIQRNYQQEKKSMEDLINQYSNLLANQIDEKKFKNPIDKLKMTFNEDEINYDRYRPTYPHELFADILSYSSILKQCNLLEIGIGTGQATKPFLDLGCQVLAMDIGDRMCNYVKEKYDKYPNFEVIHTDFMLHPIKKNSFDLIYSATAFHWLPQKEAYLKIKDSLKKNGTVALFWNHPFPNRLDDPSNLASQQVYKKYRPDNQEQVEFTEEKCKIRVQALQEAGFHDVKYKIYHRVRTLTTDEYIQLLNTYSDHRMLDKNLKIEFEAAMKHAIQKIGGKINIYDTIDLYLGKKL